MITTQVGNNPFFEDEIKNAVPLTTDHGNEEDFMEVIEGLIAATVYRYASLGGMYEENIPILDDMKQEARLAVLDKYRNTKGNCDTVGYRNAAKYACRKTLRDSRMIRTPNDWSRTGFRDKRQENGENPHMDYRCASIDSILESGNPGILGVESFENYIILRMSMEELFDQATHKEKQIYVLLGSGFTPTEISKILNIKQSLVYYYVYKAKKILTESRGNDEPKERGKKGRKK